MSSADLILIGLERVSAPDFQRLQGCVRQWRRGWGLSLTQCLRFEDGQDAFVLIAERADHEALEHLEEVLRANFPEHVLVSRAYVPGHHVPVFSMDEAGYERLQRHQARREAIAREARTGRLSVLLPAKRSQLHGVAAWREWSHPVPAGTGVYLLCDACGDTTGRQAAERLAWEVAEELGWRTDRDQGLCFCPRCIANGNADAAQVQRAVLDQSA